MKSLRTALLLLLSLISYHSHAQEQEVLAVVQRIFEGMATNNGEMVRAAFTEDATMYTVTVNEEGEVQKREGSVEKFVERVNADKPQPYSEPIWNEKIQIDGPLAAIWVDYAFYLGNEFHHCGVDAFHLMETAEGWKVFHIVDTRRTEDCKVPKKIQARYK